VHRTVRAYVALTKPRIIETLLVTTVPTMFLAAGGFPPAWLVIVTLVGGILAAGGANTLNCYIDRDIDVVMHRTQHRPLVTGEVTPRAALVFGLVMAALATALFGFVVNWLSAGLAAFAVFFYVVVYTLLLKRRTPQNIVWGGAAGCMQVLIGWAAVTGSLTWAPFVLFLVIFFWTPPHYWPLSMRFEDDYAAAGVPMLPVSVKALRRRIPLVVICVALALSLAPVVWFLLTSLKDRSETFQIPPAWFFTPTLDHYKNVMGFGGKLTSLYQAGRIDNFFQAGINSVVIAVGSTLLSTFLGTIAAFGFARFRIKWENALLAAYLLIRMVPAVSLVLPLYRLFGFLGLNDTYTGMIIAESTFQVPFVVWMMTGFIRQVPASLEESGMIDGLGRFGAMMRITLPLIFLTLGLFSILINALLLQITDGLTSHFTIDEFWWTAIWAAIVLSLVSWALSLVVRDVGRVTRT